MQRDVGNVNVAGTVDGKAGGIDKLTWSGTGASELVQRHAGGGKYLDAMIGPILDDHVTAVLDGNRFGTAPPIDGVSFGAMPTRDRYSGWREFLDEIRRRLRNIDVSGRVDRDVAKIVEPPAATEVTQNPTLSRNLEHACAARIGYENVPGPIECDAFGPVMVSRGDRKYAPLRDTRSVARKVQDA